MCQNILPSSPPPLPRISRLGVLNIMHLATPHSAILSAVIFNALIIITLILSLYAGVPIGRLELSDCCAIPADAMAGGLIAPFAGIKLIDMLLVGLHLFEKLSLMWVAHCRWAT